jgi:hypothetical protein
MARKAAAVVLSLLPALPAPQRAPRKLPAQRQLGTMTRRPPQRMARMPARQSARRRRGVACGCDAVWYLASVRAVTYRHGRHDKGIAFGRGRSSAAVGSYPAAFLLRQRPEPQCVDRPVLCCCLPAANSIASPSRRVSLAPALHPEPWRSTTHPQTPWQTARLARHQTMGPVRLQLQRRTGRCRLTVRRNHPARLLSRPVQAGPAQPLRKGPAMDEDHPGHGRRHGAVHAGKRLRRCCESDG